jgi:predicted regulator of Ras-like GTPase activity (Roadblock/LC7/MglB family)
MFGAFKKLFGKSTEGGVATLPAEPPQRAGAAPKAAPAPAKAGPAPAKTGQPSKAPPIQGASKSDNDIAIPLTRIVALLPKDWQSGVSLSSTDTRTFSVSREKILPQLAQGAVKITYKELREAFPAGIFPNKPGEDERLIDLPLNEILSQVDQGSFKRRNNQQQINVPDEIGALFSKDGQKLVTQVRVTKKEEKPNSTEFRRRNAAAAAPAPAPVATPVHVAPAPAPRAATSRQSAPEAPAKAISVNPHLAALMNQASTAAQANAPAYSAPKIENGVLSITVGDLGQNWPEGVATEIKVQQWTNVRCEIPVGELTTAMRQGKSHYPWKQIRAWMKPIPTTPSAHGEALLEMPLKIIANLLLGQANASKQAASPDEKAKAPALSSANASAATPKTPESPVHSSTGAPAGATAFIKGHTTNFSRKEVVSIPLAAISSAWPEVLRKEIEHFNLAGSLVAVPVEFLDTALKQGKVAFFWKQVCQWIEACPPAAFASNFAEVRLEWPLNVIAPMFLQARPKKEPRPTPLHIDIPDVFSPKDQQSPLPTPAQAGSSQQAPTQPSTVAPAFVAPAETAPATPRKAAKDLAELFGEPDKRNWTPNEIVNKTCQLPGLDGALIALQDGLLVASCMPPTWRTETIAAFLPQIFGRMHQYSKELKMGELMSVTFAVENGTLQIFNAGIIYFAALGKQGSSIPVPELNLIARELSRHTK